jgi:hypothetical protein
MDAGTWTVRAVENVTRRKRASRGGWAVWMAVSLLMAFCLVLLGCASEDVEVVNDPFVGPTRSFVIELPGGGYQGLQALAVREAQGRYSLQVTVMEYGDSLAVARVGDRGEFLVGDTVYALENAAEARPVARPFGNGVITQWRLTFWLDAAQAAQMAAAPLDAFKVQVGNEVHQVKLASWKAAKFRNNMALMTSR